MCSDTPRFSFRCPETVICTCPGGQVSPPAATSRGAVPGYRRVGYQGGYTGVGTRVGVPGEYYPAARGEVQNQRSGPAGSCREPEWWVLELGRTWGRRRYPEPTLRARSVHAGPPWFWVPYCRLTAKGRDSTSYSIKLVKTAKCQRKVMKRPVIVPNSQNDLRKSPLEIPGFPFCSAFSHKELMGYI